MDYLQVTHEWPEGQEGVVVVRVVGEVDVYSFPRLRDYLRAEVLGVERVPAYVGMEISGVDYLDSCGLGVLVRLLQNVRSRSVPGGVAIVGAQPSVRRIFEFTGLTKVFPVVGSVGEFFAFVARDRAGVAGGVVPDGEGSGV